MILIKIEGILGDCQIPGFNGANSTEYFTAESFGFGVERELADSAKGGTADINLGIGELQECTISKSMDRASAYLLKKAISGSSCKTADIKFVQAITKGSEQYNIVYLHYRLDNVFIKSWSTSGDADDRPTEDVAIWYNKIAVAYFTSEDGIEFKGPHLCDWDQVKAKPWPDAKMPGKAEEYKVS